MRNIRFVLGAAIATVAFACTATAAQGIKEGKWSMSMTVQADGMGDEASKAMKEMDNMPPEQRAMMQKMMGGMNMGLSGQGMTITTSRCLTNDNPVPKRDEERNCQDTHTIQGNTVSFKTVCPKSTSEGKVTYKNDSMKGTITTTEVKRGQPVQSTVEINGHYEGPCR